MGGSSIICPGGSRHCRLPPKEGGDQEGPFFPCFPGAWGLPSPRMVAQWPGSSSSSFPIAAARNIM